MQNCRQKNKKNIGRHSMEHTGSKMICCQNGTGQDCYKRSVLRAAPAAGGKKDERRR